MEEFDHKFKWTKTSQEVFHIFSSQTHLKDRYTLVGYQGSRIFWESSNDTWVSWWWLWQHWKCIFQQGDFWSFWENRPTADPEEGEDILPIWSPRMDGWSGGQLRKTCGEDKI